MITRREVIPQDSAFPFKGIDLVSPETLRQPSFSPFCKNIIFTSGIIAKRPGTSIVGTPSFGIGETVLAIVQFLNVNGSLKCVALTDKYQYSFDGVSWVNISPVDTSTNPIPWTGKETDQVSWIVTQSDEGKYLVITNGVDTPRKWNGITETFVNWVPNYLNFKTCRSLGVLGNHVLMANITLVSGIRHRERIAWSEIGSMDNWVDANNGAGEVQLTELSSEIFRLLPLADRLVCYSSDAILMLTYVGGQFIFTLETVIQGCGLIAPLAVVNLGMYHIYMTRGDLRLFDGTKQSVVISDRIKKVFTQDLVSNHAGLAQGYYDQSTNRIYWLIPTADKTTVCYMLELNGLDAAQSVWTRIEYASRVTCFGQFISVYEVTWDTTLPAWSGKKWEELDGKWSSNQATSGLPRLAMGIWGTAQIEDVTVQLDDSHSFDTIWDSIDFTVPQEYLSSLGRWLEIQIEARGTKLDLYISYDGGQNYNFIEEIPLVDSWQYYTIPIDVTSEKLRIRLAQKTDGSFAVRSLRTWIKPNGVR